MPDISENQVFRNLWSVVIGMTVVAVVVMTVVLMVMVMVLVMIMMVVMIMMMVMVVVGIVGTLIELCQHPILQPKPRVVHRRHR